jgi:DNA repair protein RadC
MLIKEMSLENRPRERLRQNGAEALSNPELLAIILQTGTLGENVIDMSNRLISRFAIDKLSGCSLAELKGIPGIGDAKAMRIMALFELSRRVKGGSISEKRVTNPEDIAGYYMEYFINNNKNDSRRSNLSDLPYSPPRKGQPPSRLRHCCYFPS